MPDAHHTEKALNIWLIEPDAREDIPLSEFAKNWLEHSDFQGKLGQICAFPLNDEIHYAYGLGTKDERSRAPLHYAHLMQNLPPHQYCLKNLRPEDYEMAMLALNLSAYKFDDFLEDKQEFAHFSFENIPNNPKIEQKSQEIARSAHLAMQMINTPANILTPQAIEDEVRAVAQEFHLACHSIIGDELLAQNFPLIHAVGRASSTPPRLIELRKDVQNAPLITIIGKGVAFDTGGLNLKPSSSMGLMKKDMGGAANALALARMILALDLPLSLRLLIPAVENSVSASSFRPSDILIARNGKSIEVNNTDAEGRLILADALAYAAEEVSDLTLSFATLTGAARVALGPDIPPFFTNNDALAEGLMRASTLVDDPIWRLPFYEGYKEMIAAKNAELDNAPAGGMAGAITAALFLKAFAPENYCHFDIYGWNAKARPARPYGGAAQAIRAVFHYLEGRYGS